MSTNATGHATYINGAPPSARTLLDQQAEVQRLLLRAARLDRERRYTLHLDFTADDPAGARELAVALATGLGLLRPEVETYSAQLSSGDKCAAGRPVFCLADGPEGAFCTGRIGHEGWHAEGGAGGLRWGEEDATGTKG